MIDNSSQDEYRVSLSVNVQSISGGSGNLYMNTNGGSYKVTPVQMCELVVRTQAFMKELDAEYSASEAQK